MFFFNMFYEAVENRLEKCCFNTNKIKKSSLPNRY